MNIWHGFCCPILTNFIVKLSRVSPHPWYHHSLFQNPLCPPRLYMGTIRTWRVLTGFQMSLSEVMDDHMDPDKAGDGARGAQRSLRTLPETCVKSKLCTLSRLSISFMALQGDLEDILVPEKTVNGVKGLSVPEEASQKISSKSDNRFHVRWSF